jgi:hypothetical protein
MSRLAFPLAVALWLSLGCATIEKDQAMDNERSLAAAGFQMKIARTPEQQAKVASLPQRRLTPTTGPEGKNRFVYADAKFCNCIWVGTSAAYDRYQKLEVEQRIAENMEAASMNWGAWGAWGPWY